MVASRGWSGLSGARAGPMVAAPSSSETSVVMLFLAVCSFLRRCLRFAYSGDIWLNFLCVCRVVVCIFSSSLCGRDFVCVWLLFCFVMFL